MICEPKLYNYYLDIIKSHPGDFDTSLTSLIASRFGNTTNETNIDEQLQLIRSKMPCKGKFPCLNLCDKTEIPRHFLLGSDRNSEGIVC